MKEEEGLHGRRKERTREGSGENEYNQCILHTCMKMLF
jgi:hypothetical protein